LKPEGVRKTAQQFVPAIVVHDCLTDDRSQPRHPVGEPLWNMTPMKGQIGATGASRHRRNSSRKSRDEAVHVPQERKENKRNAPKGFPPLPLFG
jgi:hypothetical protein